MYFEHAELIWNEFPELVPGVLAAEGVTPSASVDEPVARYSAVARARLDGRTESDLPEIQAWRRTFARMGLKPTQYRCASEALLRRFRKEGSLPRLHPLVDLCNAVSLAFAIPVAVFDLTGVAGNLVVRRAAGDEDYLTFGGEHEHPEPGEVIFADEAGQVHARRWSNRQSGRSAVADSTTAALIVAEAMHSSAASDMADLVAALTEEICSAWSVKTDAGLLTQSARRFEFTPVGNA
jgi:DNA/RNA-binding domain of Phe-tRNA-synthetase-like protein